MCGVLCKLESVSKYKILRFSETIETLIFHDAKDILKAAECVQMHKI